MRTIPKGCYLYTMYILCDKYNHHYQSICSFALRLLICMRWFISSISPHDRKHSVGNTPISQRITPHSRGPFAVLQQNRPVPHAFRAVLPRGSLGIYCNQRRTRTHVKRATADLNNRTTHGLHQAWKVERHTHTHTQSSRQAAPYLPV